MKVNTVNVTCKMMFFYLVGRYLNTFRVAVNGWGWALISYFRMGSWAYIIFWNGVAKWKRLGTTALGCSWWYVLTHWISCAPLRTGVKMLNHYKHVTLIKRNVCCALFRLLSKTFLNEVGW